MKPSVAVASGAIIRSTDECEMSRSCQSATSSSAGTTAARTMRARPHRFSLRIGLRLWGIALEPFWPDGERLFGLADLGALPVAHVRGEPLDAGGQEGERGEERGVAIARDDLRGDRLGRRGRASPSARASIVRREVRVGADGAGDLADGDLARARRPSRARPRAISAWWPASARPKVTGSAKMPWLRPIIGRPRVLAGARGERVEQARRTGSSSMSAASRSSIASDGVEHVARGHAAVKPPRLDAGELLDVGEKGDDVVLGRALDLVDARRVDSASFLARMVAAVPAGTSFAASMASQAASSTSSHTAKRRAGDQSARNSAGV